MFQTNREQGINVTHILLENTESASLRYRHVSCGRFHLTLTPTMHSGSTVSVFHSTVMLIFQRKTGKLQSYPIEVGLRHRADFFSSV